MAKRYSAAPKGRQAATKPMHAQGTVKRIMPPKGAPYSKQPKHCKDQKM